MEKKIYPLIGKSSSTGKVPSSLNSHPSSFEWAPSVQSDLFNYLKPAQRKAIRPFLQIIKRPYQEKLCISLMDYMEGHGLDELQQPVLRFSARNYNGSVYQDCVITDIRKMS